MNFASWILWSTPPRSTYTIQYRSGSSFAAYSRPDVCDAQVQVLDDIIAVAHAFGDRDLLHPALHGARRLASGGWAELSLELLTVLEPQRPGEIDVSEADDDVELVAEIGGVENSLFDLARLQGEP